MAKTKPIMNADVVGVLLEGGEVGYGGRYYRYDVDMEKMYYMDLEDGVWIVSSATLETFKEKHINTGRHFFQLLEAEPSKTLKDTLKEGTVTFVNKFQRDSHERLRMYTWIKDREYDAVWLTDPNSLMAGKARNDEWLTMDENLVACFAHYSAISARSRESAPEFEVTVDFLMDESRRAVYARRRR